MDTSLPRSTSTALMYLILMLALGCTQGADSPAQSAPRVPSTSPQTAAGQSSSNSRELDRLLRTGSLSALQSLVTSNGRNAYRLAGTGSSISEAGLFDLDPDIRNATVLDSAAPS